MSLSDDAVKPLSVDEILSARKLATKSIPVCMRGDVLAEIQELEREINQLRSDDDDPRMVDSNQSSAATLADKIRELEAEAERYTINLRLQALERKEWNKQVDLHTDENLATGERKLDLAAMCVDIFPDSLISPEMTTRQQDNFLTGLTEGQWEEVMQGLWDLNRDRISVGKSVTASLAMQPKSGKPGRDAQ
jgi:hypothetical protein